MHIQDIISGKFQINNPSDLHALVKVLEDDDLHDEFFHLWNSIECQHLQKERTNSIFNIILTRISTENTEVLDEEYAFETEAPMGLT
jgi:hypothetical protein